MSGRGRTSMRLIGQLNLVAKSSLAESPRDSHPRVAVAAATAKRTAILVGRRTFTR
jgi:hypothetical protein